MASAAVDSWVRFVKRPINPSKEGVKKTFGGTAVVSGRDLMAVIPIQKTGISMMNATTMATISRSGRSHLGARRHLVHPDGVDDRVAGPSLGKTALGAGRFWVLVLLAIVHDSFIRFRYQM